MYEKLWILLELSIASWYNYIGDKMEIIADYLIVPQNYKKRLIKQLSQENKLYNYKILTINEVQKKIFFDYDEQAIYYLVKEKNYTYKNAKELLTNMYYIENKDYQNQKLNNLVTLKNELLEKKLLKEDNLFKNAIQNKNVNIYGFIHIDKWTNHIIEILKKYSSVEIIPLKENEYTHPVYEFSNLDNEINFIANDIISKNLDLNKVYLANINNDNISTIKRIFKNYHLIINLNEAKTLYETTEGLKFLQELNLENIKNEEIKNSIIKVLNKYSFVKNIEEIRDILKEEFKITKIKKQKYKNAISEIDLKNDIPSDEDTIYLINLNKETIPHNYKDEDYISDSEKMSYLEKTYEKNNNEFFIWKNILKNTKNLIITSSKQNLKGGTKTSPLIEELKLDVVKKSYEPSNFSNSNNIYNLGVLLDEYVKYGSYNSQIPLLLNTYQNNKYMTYDNTYHNIDFQYNSLNLSYTKLNAFYECQFKYYCSYILKLDDYQQTFDAYMGSLCHYILQNMFNKNFDFEKCKENYLQENPYELTGENKIFMEKILLELKHVISHINTHLNLTNYQEIECEKNIEIQNSKIKFTGIIDKIMKYEDKIVIIDYKTGETDIDLRLAPYGLKLQLPIYIYLIKYLYPKSQIVGIYLQNIISPIINYIPDKTKLDQIDDHLKLNGYTLGNETLISEFDPTYENSEYIKSLSLTQNGFGRFAKLLTEKEFNDLGAFAEEKINEMIYNINKANFKIEPKIKGTDNISCKFCKYQSICFKTEKDNKYIYPDDKLEFLRGDNNA